MRLIFNSLAITILIFMAGCQSKDISNDNDGRKLTFKTLQSDTNFDNPISMTEFIKLSGAPKLNVNIQGSLKLNPLERSNELEVIADLENNTFPLSSAQVAHNQKRSLLPIMNFDFVTNGEYFIPTVRTFQNSQHFYWDYIMGPGKIWQESEDKGFHRVSMPFSLTEKNQNCVHNGVVSFLISDDGATSNFYYQISSETCQYFKANFWGFGQAEFINKLLPNAANVISQFEQEQSQRLPTKPINQLSSQYPSINQQALSLSNTLSAKDLSLMGLIDNGVHYVSSCETRAGLYPYCDELVLPSFSTAKSLFAGMAMLRLEKLYPGTFLQKVSDWVSECQSEQWKDVTFSHLLNMSTGNYRSAEPNNDESSDHVYEFFIATKHQDKIAYSCDAFIRNSEPGTQFVYHTSDTYLLGAALNQFLKSKLGPQADIFNDIILKEIWPAIKISPVAYRTRRTLGEDNIAFTGFGLYFIPDDMAKINRFLNNSASAELLDQVNLNSALQRDTEPRGLFSTGDIIRYSNGFWARDIKSFTSCDSNSQQNWLPFMSGFGGISVVFLPDNRLYYYFSDSEVGQYNWQPAIAEIDKFNPICNDKNNSNGN